MERLGISWGTEAVPLAKAHHPLRALDANRSKNLQNLTKNLTGLLYVILGFCTSMLHHIGGETWIIVAISAIIFVKQDASPFMR